MPLQDRADCPENFELMSTWIEKCANHIVCKTPPANHSSSILPTRLIDIEPYDGPRLVLSANLSSSEDRRYIALSHCWGDPKTVPQTREDSLSEHLQRIPPTKLSKTFQDAIVVTKELRIRYLWIDSLCIVQGSPEDFERECSIMHNIYRSAYCTLSALDSMDGSGGLFIPRESWSKTIASIPPASNGAVIVPLPKETKSKTQGIPMQWHDALKGPLSTRAWAYQEQQLSPRIIHFAKDRILWECREYVSFEEYSSHIHRSMTRGFNHSQFGSTTVESAIWRLLDGKVRPESGEHFSHHFRDTWLRSVEEYSRKELACDTDRLPAFSGLAASLSVLLGHDEYWAGIWKGDLARNLLWTPDPRTQGQRVGAQRPSLRLAGIPSWSWASYNGPILFGSFRIIFFRSGSVGSFSSEHSMYRRLLDSVNNTDYLIAGSTDISGPDRFGRVGGGRLRVSMFVVHRLVTAKEFAMTHARSSPESRDQTPWTLDEASNPRWSQESWTLVMATFLKPPKDRQEWLQDDALGLLLYDRGDGLFERVGIFHLDSLSNEECKNAKRQDITIV